MDKVTKYFNFKGTITGTNYILRILLSSIVAYISGYTLGTGILTKSMGLIGIALVMVSMAFTFQLSTVYKRMLALFPENSKIYTFVLISLQLGAQFVRNDELLYNSIIITLLIITGVLIFKNSNIDNHEG
jgi:uncharacterized membrane protein YhaH (DUF805 family)